MAELYVDEILSTPVRSVTPATPLHEAATVLLERDLGALVVVDEDDRLAGILTATDFVRLAADRSSPEDRRVGDHMRTDVVTTTPDAPVREAAATMVERRIHHVPVVGDDDQVVGMLTTMDVAAKLAARL